MSGPNILCYLLGTSPQEGVSYVLQKELNDWRETGEEGEGYSYSLIEWTISFFQK